jgi:hypothetical protein
LWLIQWGYGSDLQNASVPLTLSPSITLSFAAVVFVTRDGPRSLVSSHGERRQGTEGTRSTRLSAVVLATLWKRDTISLAIQFARARQSSTAADVSKEITYLSSCSILASHVSLSFLAIFDLRGKFSRGRFKHVRVMTLQSLSLPQKTIWNSLIPCQYVRQLVHLFSLNLCTEVKIRSVVRTSVVL